VALKPIAVKTDNEDDLFQESRMDSEELSTPDLYALKERWDSMSEGYLKIIGL